MWSIIKDCVSLEGQEISFPEMESKRTLLLWRKVQGAHRKCGPQLTVCLRSFPCSLPLHGAHHKPTISVAFITLMVGGGREVMGEGELITF